MIPPLPDPDPTARGHTGPRLDELAAEITPLFAVEQRHLRQQARLLWAWPGFTEEVLQKMLRGQVLTSPSSRGGPPCLACGEPHKAQQPVAQGRPDQTGCCWPVQQRSRSQKELGAGPLQPVPWPRHTLYCPLQESAEARDATVPCTQAMSMWPKDGAPARSLLPLLQQGGPDGFQPCTILHAMLPQVMPQVLDLGRSWEQEALALEPPESIRQQARELAQDQAAAQDPTPQGLRRGIRFLLGTGRLRAQELAEIIHSGVMVTDANWLPCRHDRQRNLWVSLRDRMAVGTGADPRAYFFARTAAPHARRRCPLQVRGLVGDRAPPCCEALDLVPDAEMIARLLPAERLIPERARLPVIWETAAAEPGGAEDPVRTLELRPCYLVGRLLGLTLHGAVQEHLDRTAQADHEAELLEQDDRDQGDPDQGDPDEDVEVGE